MENEKKSYGEQLVLNECTVYWKTRGSTELDQEIVDRINELVFPLLKDDSVTVSGIFRS